MSRACFVCIFLRIIIPFSLPAFLGFDQLVEFSRGIVLEAHSKTGNQLWCERCLRRTGIRCKAVSSLFWQDGYWVKKYNLRTDACHPTSSLLGPS